MFARRFRRTFFVLVGALLAAPAPSAIAAAQRTFVASHGNDANVCSLTAPCRQFTAALAQTADGGEIVVLDSAGYGPVTIAKSVTITAPPGIYAGISVFAGDGVTVNGNLITVVLRGLTINGLGGQNGIHLLQGVRLVVEGSDISGMTGSGIDAEPLATSSVAIKNTVLRNNFDGFYASGPVIASLDAVQAIHNRVGIWADSGSRVTVNRSILAQNDQGAHTYSAPGTFATLFVSHTEISGNGNGVTVYAVPGGNSSAVSDTNAIAFHLGTVFNFGDGGGAETIYTYNNNSVGYFGSGVSGGHALTPLGPL